jgi:hypothetical protein
VLEFVFGFGLFSLFFLLVYFKILEHHRELEWEGQEAGVQIPFIDKLNRFFSFGLAVFFLLVSFYFAMLGDPTVTTITNYTYSNITLVTNNTNTAFQTTSWAFQNLPVISGTTKVTNTAFNSGQQLMVTGMFNVITQLIFLFGIIYAVTLIVRMVLSAFEKRKKEQGGDYGHAQ